MALFLAVCSIITIIGVELMLTVPSEAMTYEPDPAETAAERTDENQTNGHTEEPAASPETTAESESSGPSFEPAKESSQEEEGKPQDQEEMTLAVSLPAQSFIAESSELIVNVAAPEGAFPESTSMVVREISGEMKTELEKASENLESSDSEQKISAVDILFYDPEHREVQPAKPVQVSVTPKLHATETIGEQTVLHVDDNGTIQTVDSKTEDSDIVFNAESFSVYAVVYTVDFHYEVDGRTYDFSIQGGDSISLKDLILAFHIGVAEGTLSESEAETLEREIQSVSVSDESLIRIVRVNEETTAGRLKEALGLNIEYSGNLTEEDIRRMNEKSYQAEQWVLFSLKAFDEELTMNVELKDGQKFVLNVTDAQYAFHIRTNDYTGVYVSSGNTPADKVLNPKSYNSHIYAYDVSANAWADAVIKYGIVASVYAGFRFVDWFDENGKRISTTHRSTSDNRFTLKGETPLTEETTFIPYAAPSNAKIVILKEPASSAGSVTSSGTVRYVSDDTSLPRFLYSYDSGSFRAVSASGFYFQGWYSEGKLISTNYEFKATDAKEDLILEPVFAAMPSFTVMGNDGVDYFQRKGHSEDTFRPSYTSRATVASSEGGYAKLPNNFIAIPKEGFSYSLWIRDDGTTAATRDGSNLSDNNHITEDTTFICFCAPTGSGIVRLNNPSEGGTVGHLPSQINPRSVTAGENTFFYYYSSDDVTITATPNTGYVFLGWFDGDDLISSEQNYNVSLAGRKNLNLTPKFEEDATTRDYWNVWFDGSNGIYGKIVSNGNNTMYSRIDSNHNLIGATPLLKQPKKDSFVTLPTADEVVRPQGSGQTGFTLKGWYEVYSDTYWAPGYTLNTGRDAVFYADWFPASYDIGQNENVMATTDTDSFIRTEMFDYSNLFNMKSLSLVKQNSKVNSEVNSEQWESDLNSRDFLFISAVSGEGRTIRPIGRSLRNQSQETTTSGAYYSGIITSGILDSQMKEALFGPSEEVGKQYVGTGNYLYKYDDSTGYYYYDSDKNAASYNQTDKRFYVYNYTNSTDKSHVAGGDGTDFLPFNYGETQFTEAVGEVNYWFGMKSEINFFLPNYAGYTDAQGMSGNRSVKGDEMVYKFAGDDDVWVCVDDEMFLDLGGIHGKVYGEINFSQGTITIAQNGATRVLDDKGIISYSGDATQVSTRRFSLPEGNHKLTLYYLERGSSQSNAAIYFNIAPRYTLQINKIDPANDHPLAGAKFGIYSDEECTLPVNLIETETGVTNEFETNDQGIGICPGLVAGKTYYLKEIEAPAGYPDLSEEVITLVIDSAGNPTCSSSADTGTWRMSDVTSSEDAADTKGTFRFCMTVRNRNETSIAAKKVWMSLDGSSHPIKRDYYTAVKLQRYYLSDSESGKVQSHNVRIYLRYFKDSSGRPIADDTGGVITHQIINNVVNEGGAITFKTSTQNGIAIYSAASQYGSLVPAYSEMTEGKPYMVNGGRENLPQSGTFTLNNVIRDTDIYVTYIGESTSGETLIDNTSVRDISITEPSGHAKQRIEDTAFNNSQTEVQLNSSNGWKYEWTDLVAKGDHGNYYYYLIETEINTPQAKETAYGMDAYITAYSSNGLSSGTITVHNTLDALKVKLRKRDSFNNKSLAGAQFRIYTEAEYEKGESGSPINALANKGFLDLDQMKIDPSDGTLLISDSAGRFYTGYLPEGTYYIVEVKSPDGYSKTPSPIEVKITNNGFQYREVGEANWHSRKADSNGYFNLYIDNSPGYILPETGGPGDKAFMISGVLLITLGGVLLLRKRRNEVMRQ